jgi:hypothetical protein
VKTFQQREIKAAVAFAMAGGQALHLMDESFAYIRPDTPACFKQRKQIAHLFDQDRARLVTTARALGVRVIKVEREGTESQHIDLCGRPLERAIEAAKQTEWEDPRGI